MGPVGVRQLVREFCCTGHACGARFTRREREREREVEKEEVARAGISFLLREQKRLKERKMGLGGRGGE